MAAVKLSRGAGARYRGLQPCKNSGSQIVVRLEEENELKGAIAHGGTHVKGIRRRRRRRGSLKSENPNFCQQQQESKQARGLFGESERASRPPCVSVCVWGCVYCVCAVSSCVRSSSVLSIRSEKEDFLVPHSSPELTCPSHGGPPSRTRFKAVASPGERDKIRDRTDPQNHRTTNIIVSSFR